LKASCDTSLTGARSSLAHSRLSILHQCSPTGMFRCRIRQVTRFVGSRMRLFCLSRPNRLSCVRRSSILRFSSRTLW
jgi:hypothetical protein